MTTYTQLKNKIKTKKAIITIVGLGYVGLPIALEFAKKGFKVNGLDSSVRRINRLRRSISYIEDISNKEIADVKKKFYPTGDKKVLNASDVIIVCVPTPLGKTHKPDVSFILSVSEDLKQHMKPGQLIVLESTTYPGTTRDLVLPILEKNKLKVGEDFYLVFSPERIDPGNEKFHFSKIPKVLGGMTKKGSDLAKGLYSQVVKKIITLSCPEAAEVTKLLENTFRIVNIGLINEFAHLCDKLGIDVWEVIEAAKTKPFGFMPFYPGPGVGGHCIPADPMYLSWKARKCGFETRMIDLAAKVNRDMPGYVSKRIIDLLKENKIKLKSAKVLCLGISYKKDINDLRESPALDIISGLKQKKADWSYHDPYIAYLDVKGLKASSIKLTKALVKKQDIVVVLTDHTDVDYRMVADNAKLIFDARNVFGKLKIKKDNIIKL